MTALTSPLIGQWWIHPVDPRWVTHYGQSWCNAGCWEAGSDPEPDWTPADEMGGDEPVEWMAVRFVELERSRDMLPNFQMDQRRRWCGLRPHEWFENPDDATDEFCEWCRIDRADVGHLSAPWDEHCRPGEDT